ncbi:hypothetical protein [Natrinema versiforme]|uniref:DUF8030 domain-containing protein n=1 Tax=Natrinema versiforme TaxID=88724 RepID=A0A4V1G0B1_9EURY|nr:hypothetical protein [Natrinema versiforme]QCS44726.1 hypothetical protein FEJ81_20835 [Natrinema versiforme]
MHSERQYQRDRGIGRAPTHHDVSTLSWSDLRLSVPNTRNGESIISFVECVLVELTHADVGAEYVSSNVWGMKWTQFIAVDDVGETFQKRHHDERLGWHEQMISRQDVREELVNRLSRLFSLATNQSHNAPVDEPDTFAVKACHQLQCEMRQK